MPDAGVELQFDVPSAFPSGSVLLTGHYLDNRRAPCQLVLSVRSGMLRWHRPVLVQ